MRWIALWKSCLGLIRAPWRPSIALKTSEDREVELKPSRSVGVLDCHECKEFIPAHDTPGRVHGFARFTHNYRPKHREDLLSLLLKVSISWLLRVKCKRSTRPEEAELMFGPGITISASSPSARRWMGSRILTCAVEEFLILVVSGRATSY